MAMYSCYPDDLPMGSFLDVWEDDKDKYLNKYVQDELQPERRTKDKFHEAVDLLTEFLETDCPMLRITEVFKGGSTKKGTDIRGYSDLDLVVYIHNFYTMQDFMDELPRLLRRMRKAIVSWRTHRHKFVVSSAHSSDHVLKLKLTLREYGETINVDILPAYFHCDNREQLEEVYAEIRHQPLDVRAYYSSSFSEQQCEFVRDKVKDSQNVKNLIRLVKFWRKTHFPESHHDYPSSYLLELITIWLWERAGSPQCFSKSVALKTVLHQLINYKKIKVDFFNCRRRSGIRGVPLVLDPANPFNNVCDHCDKWREVAKMARASCNSPLLRYDVEISFEDWQ